LLAGPAGESGLLSGWLVVWLTGRFIGGLDAASLVGRLVGLFDGWLVSRSVGWFAGCLAGWPAGRVAYRFVGNRLAATWLDGWFVVCCLVGWQVVCAISSAKILPARTLHNYAGLVFKSSTNRQLDVGVNLPLAIAKFGNMHRLTL